MGDNLKISFFNTDPNAPMKYVVIVARYDDKWILVRHKQRNTFEIPGGHIENGEHYIVSAKRELYEETGAKEFDIHFISKYYVDKGDYCDGGYLFFANIKNLSDLPDFEIKEVCFFDTLPNNLTYPNIQPILFDKVQGWLNQQSSKGELWDIYNENRKLTGKTHKRGNPLKEGEFHLVVHVWIINSKNEFLITKRCPNKGYPNMWECTGGSALKGDTSLIAAIREVQEETGLTVLPKNGKQIFTIKSDNDFADIWLFKQDFSIDEVILQENETCDAKWANKDEINSMIEDRSFIGFSYINELFELIE